MKKTVWVIVFILIIAGAYWLRGSESPSVGGSKEPIKIGFIGPLTGPLAGMGEEQRNTIELAVRKINDDGGINGRAIQFIYEDGKCDGKEAATAAQKLINIEKVKILMPVCSSESMAVAPLAEQNKVLELAVWPTTPAFSGIGDYTFRNSYSDDDTSKAMAEIANTRHRSVGIITELTDYPVGVRDSFKKYFIGLIFEESYQPNSKDFRTQITKLLANKPEAMLVNSNSPETGLAVLKQLAQQGFNGYLYGNFFATSNEVVQAKEADGIIFFGDPTVQDSPSKNQFFSNYEKNYGSKPNLEFAVAAQYDAIYILKQAIEAVGDDPTDLKDYLHNLKDFEGLLGTYGFNENGDMVGAKPSIKQIKNGQILPYKS